jgi:nucleotidyltransferase substrate binding protein (TIGR01987 family)
MTEFSADDVRWKQRLQSFSAALRQLSKAVALRHTRPLSELEQQGLIQAFEFTHEMAWKVMKDYLRSLGNTQILASRDSTRAAFAAELIVDGEGWMAMIEGRNLSVHTYNLDVANTLTQAVAERYAPLLSQFEAKMLEIVGRADA